MELAYVYIRKRYECKQIAFTLLRDMRLDEVFKLYLEILNVWVNAQCFRTQKNNHMFSLNQKQYVPLKS